MLNINDNQKFQKPPSPQDWTTFMSYAAKVRELCISWDTAMDADAYRMLEEHCDAPCIVPNLRTLGWTDDRDDVYPYAKLFLNPKLANVTLRHRLPPTGPPPLMDLIYLHSPTFVTSILDRWNVRLFYTMACRGLYCNPIIWNTSILVVATSRTMPSRISHPCQAFDASSTTFSEVTPH